MDEMNEESTELEFRAFLTLLLEMLKDGKSEIVVEKIEEILNS